MPIIPQRSTVHPHVCGEHLLNAGSTSEACRFIPTCVGNIASIALVDSVTCRFIPTCVGNMISPSIESVDAINGSSPRVWGTLLVLHSHCCYLTVHPHVCGEHHRIADSAYSASCGSSPRVWGTSAPTICQWLLPAAVHPHVCGEHLHRVDHAIGFSVHPHVCGEHALTARRCHQSRSVHPHVCGEHRHRCP